MTTNRLYHTLMTQIEQILPIERVTRLRVLAWLMTALFYSKSPHTNRLGNQIVGKAKKISNGERIRRWLSNGAIRVREWYKPVALQLIDQVTKHGKPIRLIVDGTKIGNKHQLLMVSIAYRKRALPLVWTWTRQRKGHSSVKKQVALFAYLLPLLPKTHAIIILGDSEFGNPTVLKRLESYGWYYVLRQKGRYLVRKSLDEDWHRLDILMTKPSRKRLWCPNVFLTEKHAHRTNLLVVWKKGEKEPWHLVTNLSQPAQVLRFYAKRMWIEEMFGDFKSNGVDLETTRLRHFLRLSRLTLAVSLLYVWVIAFGSATIKNGKRHLVDRKKKRQLSIFRIGYDMLERCLNNLITFSLRLSFYP